MAEAVRTVVAGQHGYLQTHALQVGDGVDRMILERVGDGNDAAHLAVDDHEHGGLGFGLQAFHGAFETVECVATNLRHARAADDHLQTVDFSLDAVTGFGVEARRFEEHQAAGCGFRPDGLAEGMLRDLLH